MGRLLIQFPGTNTTKALSETLSKNVIIVDEDLHQLRLHDGVTPGGHIIGGGGGSTYHPDLFDWKWADHICNDVQWLRADTFSWQSGSVYQAAYTHLADDYEDVVSTTTLTFNQHGSISAPVSRSPDGDSSGFFKWGGDFYTAIKNPNVGDMGFIVNDMYVGMTVETVDGDNITISSASQTFTRDSTYDTSGIYYWVYTYPSESHLYVVSTKPTLDVGDEVVLIPGDGWDHYPVVSVVKTGTTTETIGGVVVEYAVAGDGHKIVTPDQETAVLNIYTATGVAWYYILDTTNERFKLPRAKHNKYTTELSVVGNGKTLGFMDGNGREGCLQAYIWNSGYPNGMGLGGVGSVGQTLPASFSDVRTTFKPLGVSTDATKSGLIAQQTQETDQYKYLYFYVGNFTQTAIENTAGLNAELFNNKVDVGHQVIEFQAPTAGNNYTWYRKYADGWVEQGGITATNGSNATPVTLPVEMVDANYVPFIQGKTASDGYSGATWQVMPVNTATSRQTSTRFYAQGSITGYNLAFAWRVEGMAA